MYSNISQILLLYKTWRYYNQFDSPKSLGVCYWYVKIPHCGYMDHELKHISFYVQKRVVAMGMCYNPALVRNKPLGSPASVKWVYCNSPYCLHQIRSTSNGSWCMGIKGEMSGTVCVTFTWDMYVYMSCLYSLCFFCCLFITVTWWYVWCFEWASGNQEEVQACLVTLWLFIISRYSLYKTTLGLLCSWFENNPHYHKYSMDFHV